MNLLTYFYNGEDRRTNRGRSGKARQATYSASNIAVTATAALSARANATHNFRICWTRTGQASKAMGNSRNSLR